jgi:hypothetical protein
MVEDQVADIPQLSSEEYVLLTRVFTEEEIHEAIF